MSNDPTKAVTTRSFTLRTPLFSLGYTWRQEESDLSPDQVDKKDQCPPVNSGPANETCYIPNDTTTEAQRRQQIMQLLDDTSLAKDQHSSKKRQKTSAKVSARQACGYYQRTSTYPTGKFGGHFPRS